jgi:uncharacterized protein (TIGR02217 family)
MFAEEQFPAKWSWGAEGGPRYKTQTVVVESGREDRAVSWSSPLWTFRLSRTLHSADDNTLLKTFFLNRKGRGIGFRFKDWSDYKVSAGVIGTGTGSKTAFQLIKKYPFNDPVNGTASTFDRKITKPVKNTLSVYNNAVLVSPANYTIDWTTGMVTFNTAPVNGNIISANFEFDVPVRFDTDFLNISFDQGHGLYAWSGVTFMEIRQ